MMGNQWVLGLHLVFLSMFLIATKYTCLGAQNSTRSCHERERLALLQFKHSVEDDDEVLSSWVGTDCCLWKGVRCDGVTGSVVSLHLRGDYNSYGEEDYRFLAGDKVNAHLAELRHLKHLDLSGNDFQGSRIPEFIGSFKELSYLNLSNAHFSGIIPHHIGNLSNLKVLDLSGNWYYSSSYTQMFNANDMDLCGAPLPNNCSNHEKNPPATTSSNEPKNVWFYLDITCGFATGFWGIIGVLSFKKQWRWKLFMIAEVAMDKVYVAVAVRLKGAK